MLNTMIVVKMKKTKYTEWKKIFDEDAEKQAKFMRDALVGKVDENTALATWVKLLKKWALNIQYTCCSLLQYLAHKK